jgi:PAS domain S-box-containing protein
MLPGHVYWKDLNGHYLGCNEVQAKTLGLKSAKDIVHVTPYESYSVEEAHRLMESDKAIMMGEKTVTLEEEGLREDGSRGIFLTKKTPIYDDQDIVIGLLGVSFDITDRKEQERELEEAKANAERANQLKTDFISNMEHDIRSPFCAITTFATALRDDEADPEKRESLDFIAESGETLLNLCNEMLEFSKLENGTVAQLDKKFRMQNLVERVERLESIVAADKGLKFVVNYDMTIPPVLIGDHFRIFRILLNLLSNALKFTKDGSVTLTVQCLKKEKREALIRFVIEDTGIGMPEDKQQYIFERFSRLTRSNAGLYQGLGVGLPIVKKFMYALEGEIDLESIEGKGTTFVCTIPLVIPLTNDFVPPIKP